VSAPDVTVVVAVYNTMPYLETCLSSLVEQSIGQSRMQVVAVDDGSTDGSSEVLDRVAASYPSLFEVVHQPNSGGPAQPSNRALELATGRYVYFLGADDHLGSEALERMVGFADEHGSDVVIGKMVGVNGRVVAQGLYGADRVDLDPYGPELRWVLANTKLFRRDLIERLKLRYREDMAFGSDQPFTLAACVHARRISVLGSYTCYYAVKREDAGNLSYQTPYSQRVPCIGQMMAAVAELVPEGPERDTLLTRHFAWEIPRLLRADLLDVPVAEQKAVCAGIAELAERHLSEQIVADLPVSARVRVSAAARQDIELLEAVIRDDADEALPVHLRGGLAFAGYTGLGGTLPDSVFRLAPAGVSARLAAAARTLACRWTQDSLLCDVRLPLVGEPPNLVAELMRDGRAAGIPTAISLSDRDESGTTLTIEVDRAGLLAAGAGRWRLRVGGTLSFGQYGVRPPAPEDRPVVVGWRRARPHRLLVEAAPDGALTLSVEPLPAREIVAAAARRVPGRARTQKGS
jgi:hypothetical protein